MTTRIVSEDGSEAAKMVTEDSLVARLDANIEKQRQTGSMVPGTRSKFNSETVYAPNIDEVANDNDQLASMRGEGRYFGVTDPDLDKPVCSNCQRRGHMRAKCKVVVCHACGKVDDHYETQCPNSMVCLNCGEKGHFRNNCTQKRKHLFCQECESHNHTSDRCPMIWRDYIIKVNANTSKVAYPSTTIFCYNCAERGHYGDECRLPRVSKTPNLNGSAFSGENLPKNLIGQYFANLKSNTTTKRRYDDAFTNYNYMPPPSYNRNNNHNSKNIPKGPTKSGFLPLRPSSQASSQRMNYAGTSGSNYNNKNKKGSYNNSGSYGASRSPYNNSNNYKRRY